MAPAVVESEKKSEKLMAKAKIAKSEMLIHLKNINYECE
jgi:hypothetical protein